MAEAILVGGGGGGADLDLVTATAGDVMKGKVIVDSSWDPVTGTLELTGNASDAQVLSGRTYYNNDLKTKRTGTMPQRTSSNSALNCGQSRTIDYGYYPSGFTVSANSLASQTSADATAAQITKGKTAWVNGVKLTGTMEVQSIMSFSAALTGVTQVTATWTNPSKGPYAGVIIEAVRTNSGEGRTQVYRGYGTNSTPGGRSSATFNLPRSETAYMIYAEGYAVIDGSVVRENGTLKWAAVTTGSWEPKFVSSGTFTVPAGVTKMDIFCVGGGGGGGNSVNGWGGSTFRFTGGSGGGGGYTKTVYNIAVSAGQQYVISVGGGGAGSPKDSGDPGNSVIARGGDGGTSSVSYNGTVVVSAGGGVGGGTASRTVADIGGKGGSGGGGGSTTGTTKNSPGGDGGKNGGDGGKSCNNGSMNLIQSKGQGTNTYLFEGNYYQEILFAGGGGGGASGYLSDQFASYPSGAGGAGGGGAGGPNNWSAPNGVAGTAGTGGGGGGARSRMGLTSDDPSGNGGNGGSGYVHLYLHAS